ncbi:uncharacterized protein LOC128556681 [Mercenaria mercenaria]|uniref:uncharacterized protein LOC128556681 n=1 Tax=Mercenaria mercenaria TaxID=6596 RepID=UPI00234ED0F1|nr:uncharacterized protein LOC128556681 [Mercenaria mercenaria]
MDDIGINERMMMKRRQVYMLRESMVTITVQADGNNVTIHHLGSQSEGTTTPGLQSDLDTLQCHYEFNVMQDLAQWKQGKTNLLMIQDDTTTPGYCFLQLLRPDIPQPVTNIPAELHFIKDLRGRALWKNTIVNKFIREGYERDGPSRATKGPDGNTTHDRVFAFYCTSSPPITAGWLERQGLGRWPTPDMKRNVVRNGCFVDPVGSKISINREIEWRISTTLAERCLMFDLNISQIRCYVLMKMILKSHLNNGSENNISSYMCKTILLHCVENLEPNVWQEGNLITCLTYCCLQLYHCLLNEQCPHFIINENNLMAGKFSAEEKHHLLARLSDLIQNDGLGLLGILFDDIGERLKIKLSMIPQLLNYVPSPPVEICEEFSGLLYYDLSNLVRERLKEIFKSKDHKDIIQLFASRVINYCKKGNRLEQTACRLLVPHLYTTVGSMLASANIALTNTVPPEALVWFSAGLNSDALSSRLKLASAFYCSGNMERTECILRHANQQYDNGVVVPVCWCNNYPYTSTNAAEFNKICNEQNEEVIQQHTALCVRFLHSEINCVPRELQYEMYRSTKDDKLHRNNDEDYWMDWAMADSFPLLYFLQYKTYSCLQRYQKQQKALSDLAWTIEKERNLKHSETALNLLAQCMEQENKPQAALQFYQLSLQQRGRNNVAKLHICRLLAKVLNRRIHKTICCPLL